MKLEKRGTNKGGDGEKVLVPLIVNLLKIKSTLAFGGRNGGEKDPGTFFWFINKNKKKHRNWGGEMGEKLLQCSLLLFRSNINF